MPHPIQRLLSCALVGLAVLMAPVHAGTILDDSFADGNGQNQDLANNSVWLFNGRSTGTHPRTDAVGSVTLSLATTSADAFWAFFTASGSPVTLGIGDRLTASFRISIGGLVGNGQDIRGGLLNSAGTRNTANLTGGMNNATFADDTSYSFQFFASGSGSPFVAYKRNAGGLANPNNPYNSMGATDWTAVTSSATGATERSTLENATAYTLSYSVRRISATSTEVGMTVTGGNLPSGYSWTAIDTSDPITAFDCMAIRVGGSNFSSSLTVTNLKVQILPAAPVITAQPTFTGGQTLLTVGAGGQATISVTATGQGLTYQWKRDGTPVPGATAASLSLQDLQIGDSGAYTVDVTNEGGTVSSDAANLTVTAGPVDLPPVIDTHPAGASVVHGGTAMFTVVASGSNLSYQWHRNGNPISGAHAATLTLTGVQAADAGSYTVTVSNGGGNITSSPATLTVLSPTLTFTAFGPTPGATTVFPDTSLRVTFGSVPALGSSGTLTIHDAADDSVVDTVNLATATYGSGLSYLAGMPLQTKLVGGASFSYYPVILSGTTATIHPRNGALGYNRTYYVKISPGFFKDDTGVNAGIADTTTWRFTTRTSGPVTGATTLTVAADGSGDFLTLQAAVDFIPAGNTTPTTVRIRNGTYFELVHFANKHAIAFVGESVDGVVIVYPNNNNVNNTGYRGTLYANNVHDIVLANLTIRNSTPQNGSQAEAIIIKGSATSGRNMLHRVRLYSYQDTLQANGQLYVTDSYIEGDVDFLWGGGPAFFNSTRLHMLRTGGYYTQIRNPATNHGYVFRDCLFTAAAGITSTYLGRIDPAVFPYSEVVLVDCAVGDSVNNALLNTEVGVSGSSYRAGWWLLNNAASDSTAGTVRYWDNATIDRDGAPLTFAGRPAFTVMPTDAATQANYRDPVWVLNTAINGTLNGSWTPRLAPIIVGQPTGVSAPAGSSFTLTVDALGVPEPAFQWRKNGQAIPGATAASYTVAAAVAGDTGDYDVVVTNAGGAVTSDPAVVIIDGAIVPPTIGTQPSSLTVGLGLPATLTVTAFGTAPLTYQWARDGVDIPGANAATLTIPAATPGDAGAYTVTVSNAAGSVTSAPAGLVVKLLGASSPTGYAAGVTGGAAGPTVVVFTAAALKASAESAAACTIVVSGTIDLGAGGRIKLKSDKTLRGEDTSATILGTIEISNASNVIVSNLNISADTGDPGSNDGITIAASSRVLVTKCTIYDCTDGNLDVINGSDLVTISWCRFYYTRNNGHNFSNLVGSSDTDTGAGDGRSNYRVSWHHNWWTTGAMQRMIACRFGRAHMFNNYWDCAGNDYCTESRNIAAILSEHNVYLGVKNPLGKRAALPTDVGLLMTIGNVFTACTGTQLVSSDEVFVPPYSYPLDATSAVAARVQAGAGNTAVDAPAWPSATIIANAGSVVAGAGVALTAVPSGFTPVSWQWRFRNRAIAGATAATHTIPAAQVSHSGDYTVVLGLPGGDAVVSAPHTLEVQATGASVTASSTAPTAGSALTLTATVAGVTPTGYQWQLDGVDIAGATAPTLVLPHVQRFHAGSYRIVVRHAGGTLVSAATSVSVAAAPASSARVVNLSTRALAGTDEAVMIPGFFIEGTGTKRMLIRAVGPTLAGFDVDGVLADPRMVLKRFDAGANAYVDIAGNDDWGLASNAAEIATTTAGLGAFGLTSGSRDAAILADLSPGQYTVVADGSGGGTGVALVELYDVDAAGSTARLVNISTRGQVATGGRIMIPGFIVSEEGPRTFLVRAVGPGLARRGVPGALADPQLVLYRRDPVARADYAVLSNDDWGNGAGAAETAAVAAQVGAFALEVGSKDAAFVATLPPGLYTVHASGVGGATGVALVEVYLVP